ncbi:hypothetical protein [Thiomicrorhabdus sediminis]|nr:hypothetical protein [Thiomicrorhabdus sediminis]
MKKLALICAFMFSTSFGVAHAADWMWDCTLESASTSISQQDSAKG